MTTNEDSEDYFTKEIENEHDPLNTMEIIEINNTRTKRSSRNKLINSLIICLSLILVALLVILVVFGLKYFKLRDIDNYKVVAYKYQKTKKKIKHSTTYDATKKNKNAEATKGTSIKVGFLYPSITKYIVSLGEHLIEDGDFDVFFITKSSVTTKVKYSERIKRINAFDNRKLLQKAIKDEEIDYLILQNNISKDNLKWLKSLNVKIIGLNEEDSVTKKHTSKELKYMELFDVLIHSNPSEYLDYKKLGLTNNIYIPNINSLSQLDDSQSNSNNHNIIMFGKLNDKSNDAVSLITAMTLIIKDYSDTNLKIISSDKPSSEITKLITVFKLGKNIAFSKMDSITSSIFSNSYISVFTSLSEEYSPIINMAKSLSIPCIVSSDETNSTTFKDGVIKIDMSNYEELSKEIIKLLKSSKYKKEMGEKAKISYYSFKTNTLVSWTKLLESLKSSENIQDLREEIESFFWKSKEETKKATPAVKTTIEVKKEKPTQKIEKSNQKTKKVEGEVIKDNNVTESKPKEIATVKEKKAAKQNVTTIEKATTKVNKVTTESKLKGNTTTTTKENTTTTTKEKTTTKDKKVITESKQKKSKTVKEKVPGNKTIKVSKNTTKIGTLKNKEKKDTGKSHKSKKKHTSKHKKKDKKKN